MPVPTAVTLVVYDVRGRRIATLVEGIKQAGKYSVRFNGSRLASGTYLLPVDHSTGSLHTGDDADEVDRRHMARKVGTFPEGLLEGRSFFGSKAARLFVQRFTRLLNTRIFTISSFISGPFGVSRIFGKDLNRSSFISNRNPALPMVPLPMCS